VVTQPAPIEFTLGVTDPSCAGLDDGVITVTATAGGVPPYTYRLKGGKSQASTELCGLSAGTFTVEVVDAHGCLAAKVIELKQPPQCNKK